MYTEEEIKDTFESVREQFKAEDAVQTVFMNKLYQRMFVSYDPRRDIFTDDHFVALTTADINVNGVDPELIGVVVEEVFQTVLALYWYLNNTFKGLSTYVRDQLFINALKDFHLELT